MKSIYNLISDCGETSDHVKRVSKITEILLRHIGGYSENEISVISKAAMLHDIGKLGIPEEILNKKGKFTDEEYEVMKGHSALGERVVEIFVSKDDDVYKYACDIARHHHERFDGKGYPDNLKGNEISKEAQIVSIADVIDALVSKRVYKDAIAFEESVQMIKDGKCGCFNPELINSFLEVKKEIKSIY